MTDVVQKMRREVWDDTFARVRAEAHDLIDTLYEEVASAVGDRVIPRITDALRSGR